MKKLVARVGVAAAVLLGSLMTTGCPILIFGAGAAAGVGIYTYVRGESKRDYPVPHEKAWQASQEALKELEMPVFSTTKDKLKGVLKARRADGQAVQIKVNRVDENITRIRVRVGKFGDKDASVRIHEAIAKKLGLPK